MSGTTNLTLKQRRKMQGIAMPADRAERSDKKEISKKIALLILFLAFGIGIVAGMIYFRPDQRIADLNQMEALLSAPGNVDMPHEVRDQLENDSESIRRQMPHAHDDRFDQFAGRIAQFFRLPPDQQLAHMKQHEQMRMAMESRRAAESANANANGQNGNGSSNGNGRGGRSGRDDTQRTEHMEQRLAQRPPQQRGQFTLLHQMGGAVRQQMNSK